MSSWPGHSEFIHSDLKNDTLINEETSHYLFDSFDHNENNLLFSKGPVTSTDESEDTFRFNSLNYDTLLNNNKKQVYHPKREQPKTLHSWPYRQKYSKPFRSPPHSKFRGLRSETDTASNDESESTVVSLGQKIKVLARQQNQISETTHDKWDTEWTQNFSQGSMSPNDSRFYRGHGVSNVFIDIASESCTEAELVNISYKNQHKMSGSESDIQEEYSSSPESDGSPKYEKTTYIEDDHVHTARESPECILEDIIEESSISESVSSKSKADSKHDMNEDPSPDNFEFNKTFSIEKLDDESEPIKVSIENKEIPDKPQATQDFSCYTNLPSYFTGTTPRYIARSFRASRSSINKQSSSDLVEALSMIENEQKKERRTPKIVEDLHKSSSEEKKDKREFFYISSISPPETTCSMTQTDVIENFKEETYKSTNEIDFTLNR